MTDAIELAQHILTFENDEWPTQVTGEQLKEICQALIELNNKVIEYKIFMKRDENFINEYIDKTKEAERKLAKMTEKYEQAVYDHTHLESLFYPLQEKYNALKDKYRWRKQSVEPAPKTKQILVCTKYKHCNFAVIKGAVMEQDWYWRPLDEPESEDENDA